MAAVSRATRRQTPSTIALRSVGASMSAGAGLTAAAPMSRPPNQAAAPRSLRLRAMRLVRVMPLHFPASRPARRATGRTSRSYAGPRRARARCAEPVAAHRSREQARQGVGPSRTRRSSWALSATTMVERLMRTAPTAGDSVMPAQARRAGGERDGDDVVAGRPGEVLDHLAVARPATGGSTPATPRGSLEASTTPADSMATSVPAPMAMPTSARASAGASLTPSPTIATRRPRCLQLGHGLGPCPRGAPRRTPRRCRARRATASATWRASPVIIATSMPSCAAARRPPARASGRTSSSSAKRADDLVVADQVEHGRAALAATPSTGSREVGRHVEAALAQQRRAADGVARRRRSWPRRRGR